MKFRFIKCVILLILLLLYNSSYSNEDLNKQTLQKNNSSFNNDLFSGIAIYSYNFNFPKGVGNLIPTLGLSYNSARVDYLNQAGYGFDLSNDSIFRSTKKGNDKLYLLDEYSINSSFSNNELKKTDNGNYIGVSNNDTNIYNLADDTFVVKDNNGNTYYFGTNIDSKQINPENNITFRWMLSKTIDQFGNEIHYSYIKADNNIYLSEINYSVYTIKINYYEKSFSTNSYLYGFYLENHKLLKDITVEYNGSVIKSYNFTYIDSESIFPKLTNVKEISGEEVNDNISFDYYDSGIGINLLKDINNGKGLITSLEYKAASLYKNTTVPFLLKTLNKVTYQDTTTGLKYSNTYDYYGGNFYFDSTNIYNRGYTGFSKVKVIDDDGSYRYIYFHQSDTDKNNLTDTENGEFEDHISKKGKIYREEEYDKDGLLYTSKITKWINVDKGDNVYFVFPERITSILWNKVGNHFDSAETFSYDDFGNIIENIKYGEVNANTKNGDFQDIKDDKKIYKYKFAIDTNNIFLNKQCEEEIYDNNNNQISLQKYFYDNLGEYEIEKGLLTKKSIFFSLENRFLNQNFTYNNGLLKTESDFLGNMTSYTYDNYNLFLISKTNPKGWIENYTYDYKVQKPVSIIDVNGINYKIYYDNFGNTIKKSVINPDTNIETILEENTINKNSIPNYIENKKYSDGNNYITSRIYLDGFGREIETKVSSKYSGIYSTVKTRYDKNGNKEFVTYPIFENNLDFSSIGTGEKGNILTYDTLGRILTQTNKTGVTSFEYDLLKTIQTNQKGVKKELTNNIFGNLVKVVEHNSNEVYETNYEYNVLNKFSKITDAKGNIRNFYYDSLARVKKQEDLHDVNSTNFGSVEYSYNDNSLVTSKKVMSGDIISFSYDELGRVLSESVGGQTNNFVYDVGNYAKGKLTNTSKANYSEEYKYNYLGQKIEDKKIYTDNNYTLKYEFDLLGNITKIIYPDYKETNYFYENGYVNKVNYNNTEILSNVDYEANNKPKKRVFSNGLTDEESFDYEYGYRLIGKKSYLGENYYQNLNYTFDSVGNILNITDTSNLGIGKNASYTYDDLNRLLTSNILDGNNNITNQSFSYDSIGNIINNSQVGEYSYINGTNPQAVTQIGTGTFLNYDSNGNVNYETINGITKDYTYNARQELLNSLVNGVNTSYLYDNNSSRVQKESVNGSGSTFTIYLNNDFEIENVCHSEESLTETGVINTICENKTNKYIYLGDKKIFTIEDKNSVELLVYNLADHLGGGSVDVSHGGVVLQKSDYYPYGGSRVLERNDTYKNKYLFTGKELDEETNLQYFEVRYYNPDIGRFYSQDRVFWELGNTKRGIRVLSDPQQLNSYSYARNNPLIYVDPSGEIAMDVGNPATDLLALYVETVVVVGTFLGEAVSDHIVDNIIEYNASKKEAKAEKTKVQTSSVSTGGSPGGGGKKPEKDKNNQEKGKTPGNPISTSNALTEMEKFLGKGYKDMGNGRYISKDGLRQGRIGDNDILGKHAGGPHINLETFDKVGGKIIKNKHLFFKD